MSDLIFEQHRADALKRRCEYCLADTGQLCFNPRTGHVLEHQPAHHRRIHAHRPRSAISDQSDRPDQRR